MVTKNKLEGPIIFPKLSEISKQPVELNKLFEWDTCDMNDDK